jgi:hypothetical protein
VLGEHLTPSIVGSFALILTGSVLATRASGARPGPDGPRTAGEVVPGPPPCGAGPEQDGPAEPGTTG